MNLRWTCVLLNKYHSWTYVELISTTVDPNLSHFFVFFLSPKKKSTTKIDTQTITMLMQFCGFYRFVWSTLGYFRSIFLGPPRLHFSTSFKDTSFWRIFFNKFLTNFRKKTTKWKVFKTLRLCMILGCRQVESKHAHLWQKCIFFLFRISLINWLNLEPKSDEK